MIFPRGNVTPGIQLISTVSTPTMEAAIALWRLLFSRQCLPQRARNMLAARKEYTEFNSPRILPEVRARIVEEPINRMLITRVIFFNCFSEGFLCRAPCQISLVKTVDIVISPQSIVDITAARTAAMIKAQTMAGSSFKITSKKALFPLALYLYAPKDPIKQA